MKGGQIDPPPLPNKNYPQMPSMIRVKQMRKWNKLCTPIFVSLLLFQHDIFKGNYYLELAVH